MGLVQVICTDMRLVQHTPGCTPHRCTELREHIQNRCVELRTRHIEMAHSGSLVVRQKSPNELSSAGQGGGRV